MALILGGLAPPPPDVVPPNGPVPLIIVSIGSQLAIGGRSHPGFPPIDEGLPIDFGLAAPAAVSIFIPAPLLLPPSSGECGDERGLLPLLMTLLFCGDANGTVTTSSARTFQFDIFPFLLCVP